MKTGEGYAVTDLSNGSIDGTLSVTKLEDGYVMFQIARDGVSLRVTVTTDQAVDFAAKVKEAAE